MTAIPLFQREVSKMARFKVGVQLQPQHTTVQEYRAAWQHADRLGVDSIWTWDHFFPITGEPSGAHFEAWSLLAAMAVDTQRARLGTLVTAVPYRNPDLLADMARTVDQLSGGRVILGLGAGWSQRDFDEYGYEFTPPAHRLRNLEAALPRIRRRLLRLNPPAPDLPILIGGAGEQITLRLVAEHADMWNSFGPPEQYAHKNRVLDDWCRRLGRDTRSIERTVLIHPGDLDRVEAFLEAGAEHLIYTCPAPFDLKPVERLLSAAAR